MLEQIAFATRRHAAIVAIEKAVALYGGWAKFEADLRKDVVESLLESLNEKVFSYFQSTADRK